MVESNETPNRILEPANLAPADGGIQAWMYLVGAFIVETLLWLVILLNDEQACGSATSFVSEAYLGQVMRISVSYMSEWFFVRRGLANGVMNAGTAVGGLVLPLILPSIIQPHGTGVTLRYLSVAVFVSLSVVLPFIRPRLPEDRVRNLAVGSNTRWFTHGSFWVILFVTTLQGFAYFLPILYLPTFAKDMKLSDGQASIALALLNGSSVISRISLGQLSDVFNPWLLTTFTLSATSVSTFVLWGAVATSFGTLSVYAVLFGALAGGFSSLWTGFVRPIAKDDPTSATTMLGMLMLSRGLGNVLSTPLSSALLTGSMLNHVHSGLQHGSRWNRLIVYIGTIFAGAALVGVVGWRRDGGLNRILLRHA
ncbi:hypothetical protein FRC09_012808 [Ceratobasidium sp. 395]|nr:hypothetical protein FRC09_012808 [Ceratobasidium sp. 395]